MAKRPTPPDDENGDLPGKIPFGTRLKAIREAAGLTQEQLADKAGLHLGAVFKLEQGRREPTWATVQALASALGTNCLAFAAEEGSTSPDANLKSPARPKADAPPGEAPAPAKKGRGKKRD